VKVVERGHVGVLTADGNRAPENKLSKMARYIHGVCSIVCRSWRIVRLVEWIYVASRLKLHLWKYGSKTVKCFATTVLNWLTVRFNGQIL
jgi:hypothetical protein